MRSRNSMRSRYLLTTLVFAVWLLTPTLDAQSEESFFKGKTIRFIASSTPGGGTDTLVRLQARHFGKHVPGNPRIIAVNMPGAGGLVAANYLWNRARPDGLTVSNMNTGLVYRVAQGGKGVRFKLDEFTWLGQVAMEGNMVYVRADRPFTSFEAIKKASRKPKMGSRSKAHSANVMLKVIEQVLEGVKFEVIYGYPGTAEILLDIERGALDGRSHSIGSLLATRGDWIKRGFVKTLVVTTAKRDPRLPDVPTLEEIAPEGKKHMLEAVYAVQGRSYAMPPGIPPKRAKILRDAYAAMHKDPAFVREGKKMGWNIELARGEELQRKYKSLVNNRSVMEFYRKILGDG